MSEEKRITELEKQVVELTKVVNVLSGAIRFILKNNIDELKRKHQNSDEYDHITFE